MAWAVVRRTVFMAFLLAARWSQSHHVLPRPALARAEPGVLEAHVVEGFLEARAVLLPGHDRAQELVVLDGDEVLEADAVGVARHERAVVGVAVTAEDRGVAARRPPV